MSPFFILTKSQRREERITIHYSDRFILFRRALNRGSERIGANSG